ncbi:MAG: alkaline phosphatase [Deltaproteobacteria bacterium]|nr:alkaline phosphatase [Deltaproteobacteria bacterium]
MGVLLITVSLVWFFPAQGAEPKNVILLIGDGMGPESVGLAIYYNRFMNGMDKRLNMERLMAAGNTGYCLTYQYGTVVTDSASAATALASGVKTRDAIIGKDHEGRSMKTLVDITRQLGKSAGVISNTRMTHATPAAFYANVVHRDMENEIAAQLVERGDLAIALSGGAQHFIPAGVKVEDHPALKGIDIKAGWGGSRRKDSRDLIGEARNKGYAFVASEKELLALDAQKTEKLFGLFSASSFPSAIDRQPQHQTGVPTLSQLTEKSLEILKKNPRGFFLMVEGGQIDNVAHGNDVASVLHEMMEFDGAMGVVMSFAEQNPDTLVVVTADHDTGGLAIASSSYNPPPPIKLASGETWKTKYNFAEKVIFEKMAKQKKSFLKMVEDSKWNPAALKKEIEESTAFAITEEQAAALIAKDSRTGFPTMKENRKFYKSDEKTPTALMGRLFGKEMNTAWAVGTHTHTPVMIFANGPLAEKFRGLLDNVEVPQIIAGGWGATLPAPK